MASTNDEFDALAQSISAARDEESRRRHEEDARKRDEDARQNWELAAKQRHQELLNTPPKSNTP